MAGYVLHRRLPDYLQHWQARIEEVASRLGLDFFPTVFEILSYDQMNEIAAYGGFPTRYPHWRFGMEYEHLKKSHEYGLSKIYEMVINNNPAIAYLLEGNSLVDQKLVMSHVLGHVDFFKNNYAFSATNQGINRRTNQPIRKWVDTMANHASVVRRWVSRIGIQKVENFIDDCLRLENLLDPQLPYAPAEQKVDDEDPLLESGELALLPVDRDYMKSFINPTEFVEAQKRKQQEDIDRVKEFEPRRDVLLFLIQNAPLEQWQQDILRVVRREAYYFLPQMQTKIMNEGWASYWHSKLMTEHVADSSEIVDYAERNAGVMQVSGKRLNPYKIGVELFRNIEQRWNRGQHGLEWEQCQDLEARQTWDKKDGLGRQKIFEVRKLYTDVSFIDEFITPEFVIEHRLFAFGYNEASGRREIESREFQKVKSQLIASLTNGGSPIIHVVDDNAHNRGELRLEHSHQGIDLKVDWARRVLESLYRLWSRPVAIVSKKETKEIVLRFDGSEHSP